VNACFKFVREPLSFEDCDGKNAADAYCRERGWTHATTFEVGQVEVGRDEHHPPCSPSVRASTHLRLLTRMPPAPLPLCV
jgi:hypothetical protein